MGTTVNRWPSADTGTRIVFITRHIEAPALRARFGAAGALAR